MPYTQFSPFLTHAASNIVFTASTMWRTFKAPFSGRVLGVFGVVTTTLSGASGVLDVRSGGTTGTVLGSLTFGNATADAGGTTTGQLGLFWNAVAAAGQTLEFTVGDQVSFVGNTAPGAGVVSGQPMVLLGRT
jgi:hypothetical protein